jgi:hypothetical protein
LHYTITVAKTSPQTHEKTTTTIFVLARGLLAITERILEKGLATISVFGKHSKKLVSHDSLWEASEKLFSDAGLAQMSTPS